jgi:hypothetical protein
MMGCITDIILLTIGVPRKGSIFKMRLIIKFNGHPPFKLPLDR